ncbi:Holliday junction branch migration protein RuvA [Melghirimyces algeriensis]|uniref:Holliday junction branch migration complex subunit RuvA n=1 Tax=Melghirimyces algeriensis TaxID=910412 RepID=A0A521AUG2_9BACL|nr:Holliday junction branch migration protein RuvA [Melghirimyces algeriensis]SMO38447.1 Holliday junction DNA helicase subunit RuvA [Melghirimyces algeriensis]
MIDYIKGIVAYRTTDTVLIETHGVGYRIFCSNPFEWEEGATVQVFTHQVIREDAHLLYGFKERDIRDLFRLLLDVSGIGPKVALSITGAGQPKHLVKAVEEENLKFLTKLPGIGKKTAQRIVLDLKDKLEKAGWTRRFADAVQESTPNGLQESERTQEAIEAMKSLGYNEGEASQAVQEAREGFGETSPNLDEWIRRALQLSMKRQGGGMRDG